MALPAVASWNSAEASKSTATRSDTKPSVVTARRLMSDAATRLLVVSSDPAAAVPDPSSVRTDSPCAVGGGLSRATPFDVAQGVVSAVEPRAPVGSGQNIHAGRRRPLAAGVARSDPPATIALNPADTLGGPPANYGCIRPPLHPTRLRCSSLEYSRYSRSSCLAGRAHRRPRCVAVIRRRTT